MAKYRITSIPQSKPKAQNGGEKKRLRNFLFGKEETPTPADIPMIPVPGLNETDNFDMFQPRTEEQIAATLPTVWTQGTTTPTYDYTYDQQNRMFNPVTWHSYQNSLEKKLGLPYTGPGGKSEKATVTIPERFTPDYSLGEDGQPLQCPEGKYPYKGQCFSEEMYLKLKEEEYANEQYSFDTKTQEKKQQFENEITDIRQKNLEFQQNFQKQRATDYYDKFKNSKKSDKIEPYESVPSYNYDLNAKIPELDAEGNPVLDPKTGEPKFRTQREVLQDSFLVIEDKEAGKVNIYPKDIVYDRIVNNGFQAEQFKNYWGVDPKQVKDQLGDVMTAAKSQYDVTMQQKILQRALDQGKPVSEVVKSLPRSLATKQGAQSFVAPTQKLIDDAIESIKKDLQASAGTDQSKVTQGQDIFFSNNPQAEWEKRNYPNVFDKYYIDKTARGEKAYDEWMDKYGSTGQYDNLTFAKDDRMANQRAINQFNQQALTRNAAESAKQSAESSVFNKALGEYAGNFSIDINKQVITEALDNLDEKGKLKFLKDLQSDPNQAYENLLKTKKDGQSYSDILNDRVESALYFRQNQPVFKQGKANQFNIDESTGAKVKDVLKHPFDALYYLANEREEMWDGPKNLTYSERKKIEEETGMDLGTMPLSVMSPFNYLLQPFNPFKIGFNLREGYDKGEFLPALGKELWDVGSTYGGIKGLNAITRGAKWYKPNVVKPLLQGIDNPLTTGSGLIYANQLFDSAQQSFDQGDYTQAAIDAGLGALSAYPAYRGLQNLNFLRPSASGFSKYTLLESNPLRNQSQPLSLPQPNRLLGFKKGGSLPKAQMGSLVKNVSPVIRNLPGFTERRNIVQGLKQLGYLGPQTMGADMLRAAASNESLKKLMQSAIDYDRTGFRQVSGQFHPVGNRLDNFGNHGQYDMTKPVLGSSLSEYENMLSRGVDINDPFSLGAYQATSIPMDQYGYRAGLPDMSRMDGLYFAATPETQQYGPYQFKVKQDIDLESGNWQDLFDQYILRKNRIYQGGRLRKDLDPSKIYFADPNKGGIQGSGIDMRIWAGGIGNQVGIIDPTFKFTDLKNMSAEDYLDMDTYKKSLINRWNTGFRGDYQSGGMTVELTQDEIDQYVKGGYIIEEQ